MELEASFPKFGKGLACVATGPSLENPSDSDIHPARSRLMVCENTHALGPSDSVHAEIDAKRKGRFSHWTAMGFIFLLPTTPAQIQTVENAGQRLTKNSAVADAEGPDV